MPNFDNFGAKKDSFRNYKQRFENCALLKGITKDKEYCVKLLLNSIGAKNFNMITAIAALTLPRELKYEIMMKLLDYHLAPKNNILVAQNQFLLK